MSLRGMTNEAPGAAADADLLAAAEHDASAFGELYRRHVRRVHAWFAVRIDWAAADLTAETFARAWARRRGFRDQHDGWALPWLLGIAHNVLRESARRDRIESRARERLGLPLELAEDDGYSAIDERLSPRLALGETLLALPKSTVMNWRAEASCRALGLDARSAFSEKRSKSGCANLEPRDVQ